jgi:hypothetical protein
MEGNLLKMKVRAKPQITQIPQIEEKDVAIELLFAIFVTFCANVPWCFAGASKGSSFTEDRKGHEDKPRA